MISRRVTLALHAALLLVAASASAHAGSHLVVKAGPDRLACVVGSSPAQGCADQRCLYVEQWVGARTAGPTFPTTCRQVATIEHHPAA